MGSRARALIGTVLVVAVPAATITMLHGLADRRWFSIDYSDFGGWLARTSLTDALAAIARLAALGLAYYLLVSTLLYLVALTSGSRTFIRLTRPFALPIVRSLADRIVAGSIAIGALATPLLASSPPADLRPDPVVSADIATDYLPTSRRVDAVESPELLEEPPTNPVAFTDRPTTAHEASSEIAQPEAETAAEGQIERVVRRGDHLWGLAEKRLQAALGRPALDHEVAPYWRQVVDENRDRIRSGNPDLIHPGEVVVLPDPTPFIPSGS